VIIQRRIRILSERIVLTYFISKSLEFIELSVKKSRGCFCLNEMRRKIAKAF